MKIENFSSYENLVKRKRNTRASAGDDDKTTSFIPHLQNIQEVKFFKGFLGMSYKFKFGEEGQKTEFLKALPQNYKPKKIEHPRGILNSKLQKIKKSLVTRMAVSRREFWDTLPTNEKVEDLLNSRGPQ